MKTGVTSAAEWVTARLPCDVTHLDIAACGRVSTAVLDLETAHLRREASGGGYVAEAEAEERLAAGREALASMVGLRGSDVAFCESGGAAFSRLLSGWPLGRGARIGTVSGEYGANAAVLRQLAGQRGWHLVDVPVDGLGRIVDVPVGLDLVTFPHVPSQRGIVQDVDAILRSSVPVVLDVAQSLGQVAVPAGCAGYIGTSRKWLCGPRGVGFLLADPAHEPGLTSPPTLAPTIHVGIRRFESTEAHVAGRLGLGAAVQEWSPALPLVAIDRTRELRELLTGLTSWHVVEPVTEPTAITTLAPVRGQDPVAVRRDLLAQGFLTSAVPVTRAAEQTGPILRISTAAWVTTDDLLALARTLQAT